MSRVGSTGSPIAEEAQPSVGMKRTNRDQSEEEEEEDMVRVEDRKDLREKEEGVLIPYNRVILSNRFATARGE